MPNLQRQLSTVLIVSLAIVVAENLVCFISNFALVAIALGALQFYLSSRTSQPTLEQPAAINYFPDQELCEEDEDLDSHQAVGLEQQIETVPILELSEVGDPWVEQFIQGEKTDTSVVVKAEPVPLKEPDEQPKDTLQLLMVQLESLPQKKGKRQVWGKVCKALSLDGGGKVRDGSLSTKAKFLKERGIDPLKLVKAKVVALALAA